MGACTFFGHKDYFADKNEQLIKIPVSLIEKDKVDTFYVGNQGNFDISILKILNELKKSHEHIKIFVVLAYHPSKRPLSENIDPQETLFPEELEKIHPKFAISERNKWMISRAEYAVVFVRFSTGGATKYKTLAEKKRIKSNKHFRSDITALFFSFLSFARF